MLPCPEKWNSGDLNSALLARWGDVVREMVNLFSEHDEVLCGKILSYLLYDACSLGHLKVVEYLIMEVGCDPDSHSDEFDEYGRPICCACHSSHLDIVQFLVTKAGIDLGICQLVYEKMKTSRTLLHHACEQGYLDIVKWLVTVVYVDPMIKDWSGMCPLHYACKEGHLNVVEWLVGVAHVNPIIMNKSGMCPLHYACKEGHLNVVEWLVTVALVYPMIEDSSYNTMCPLHYASKEGHLNVVEWLVTVAHVDPMIKDRSGMCPLYYACKEGHLNLVEWLVTMAHVDPMIKDKSGMCPLHYACKEGHLNLVEWLVTMAYVDPMIKDRSGMCPLHYACKEGHLNLVEWLVTVAHVDPMIKDKSGMCPLHYACKEGHLNLVEWLVTVAHVDPMIKDKSGMCPLHYACKEGHLNLVEWLVTMAYVDPMIKDQSGMCPLHYACKEGHLNLVEWLVTVAHVDPMIKDKSGMCPLHYACKEGHLNLVEWLVTVAHVDPMIKDKSGMCPLHYACKEGLLNVVKWLVTMVHVDQMIKDQSGMCPLHYSYKEGHLNVVEWLVTVAHCNPASHDGKSPLQISNEMACTSNYTPLHYACEKGILELVKVMVNEFHVDQNIQDASGCTPLHYACKDGCFETVKWLVTDPLCNLNVKNKSGCHPLTLAFKYRHMNVVKYLLSTGHCECDDHLIPFIVSVYECYSQELFTKFNHIYPNIFENEVPEIFYEMFSNNILSPSLKIFVVGNPSAGKSTLIKAIEGKVGRKNDIIAKFKKVSGVELKTAGIVPITIQLGSLGQITFYDFAGQAEYYSSHTALLKNLTSSQGNVILIVVDLSKDVDEISSVIKYWNSFVSNLLTSEETKCTKLVIFTHVDALSRPDSKIKELKEKDIVETETSILINCTKAASNGLNDVCDIIIKKCTQFQNNMQLDICSTFLSGFLYTSFKGEVSIKLDRLSMLLKDKQIKLDNEYLLKALCTLNEQGKILFLCDNKDINNNCIILDIKVLLAEVNGTIFAPENFKQHYDFSSLTGVVPLTKIKEIFSEHNEKMIVDFMCHFEFCHEIGSREVELIADKDVSQSFYFFPALVKVDRPEVFFQDSIYKCGWYLSCNSSEADHLSSRFLHVLLLRLAFSFALIPDPYEVDTSCPVIQRKCNVWKSGIHWINRKGVEVVVEVVEQSTTVVVMVGCMMGKELAGVELRTKVIKSVLDVKEEHCKNIKTRDKILHPQELKSYPLSKLDQLLSFSIHELSCGVAESVDFVTRQRDTELKAFSIKELLYFEPYTCFNKEIVTKLFDESNLESEISESFLSDLARCAYSYKDSLKSILLYNGNFEREFSAAISICPSNQATPHHQCFLLFHTWLRCSPTPVTFRDLREVLDRHSVFAGRNPLKL